MNSENLDSEAAAPVASLFKAGSGAAKKPGTNQVKMICPPADKV